MENQVTFRLPREVARALTRCARERGVPKSLLVREALAAYLATPGAAAGAGDARARITPFLGVVALDRSGLEREALARRIREHNWRE
ncbi:MAG TPA: CopG family transcriptional regulator [Gemmatimonadales bacterium]